MQDIAGRQNKEPYFGLLQARQWLWKIAERWLVIQMVAVIPVPIIGAIIALSVPEHRASVAVGAILLTLLDALFIDRRYRHAVKVAAKASEAYDTKLFKLPWNELAAGPKLQPEQITSARRTWDEKRSSDQLIDWYPTSVDNAPFHVARLICQRVNVTYDSALRMIYSQILFWGAILVALALTGIALLSDASLSEVLLSYLFPIAPLLIFAIREGFRQRDAAEANQQIRNAAQAVVEDVIERGCTAEECTHKSVQLQAAIYTRRALNPLVAPGLYGLFRNKLEKDMNEGADHWLREGGYIT
ncbi:S-4TM family putative pore-forming effector [Alteriqipengyuania lutimaris]|uniref:Uncharacterized protein n=1 Tax=Alteriqipengyuania lutimaris TaxID=1538146 RepID=A0A395LNZ9_9SPHN|nr:S-4TM family putative pore-forming effector [Alteriqipengyuania lutimaris]MBB3034747.1 hypothetical protein [Alteriqipengyuania lutimaris]RDS76400.1 hypothetical protein DL238_01435 [Alteriqipengyuania lutimaris]